MAAPPVHTPVSTWSSQVSFQVGVNRWQWRALAQRYTNKWMAAQQNHPRGSLEKSPTNACSKGRTQLSWYSPFLACTGCLWSSGLLRSGHGDLREGWRTLPCFLRNPWKDVFLLTVYRKYTASIRTRLLYLLRQNHFWKKSAETQSNVLILLPQLLECWDCRCILPCLASNTHLFLPHPQILCV